MEKKVISCEFNIDTACVEVKYADGSMIAIYCPRVEDQVADNMYEQFELIEWTSGSCYAETVSGVYGNGVDVATVETVLRILKSC